MDNLLFKDILDDLRINNVEIARKKLENINIVNVDNFDKTNDFMILYLNSIFLSINGEFEKAQNILGKIVTNSNEVFITYLSFISLVEIKANLERFDEAELMLLKAYEIQKSLPSNDLCYEQIELEYKKSSLYFKQGLYQKEIQNLEDLLKNEDKFGNNDQVIFLKTLIKHNLAVAYKTQGKFEKALQMLIICSSFYQKFPPCIMHVRCLSVIGLIYQDIGDLRKGLEFQFKALDICHTFDNKQVMSLLYTNIANIYNDKGEIDLGLEYALKSYETKLQIGNFYSLGITCGILSQLYKQKSIKELALNYINKALEIFQRLKHTQYIVFALLDLIELSVDYNSDNKVAQDYFLQMEELCKDKSDFILEDYVHLAQAIIKKYQKNDNDILESKKLFISFIKKERVQKKLIVDAIFELMEIYALELETKQSEESFNQIDSFLEQVKEQLREYNSHSALVSIFIIHSKLYAIKLAVDDANNVLRNALIITELNGLISLSKKLEQEQNNLLKTVQFWASKANEEISLYQRLKDTQILQYIININRGKAGSWSNTIRV